MVSRRAISSEHKVLIAVIAVVLVLGSGTVFVVMSSPNKATSGTSSTTTTTADGTPTAQSSQSSSISGHTILIRILNDSTLGTVNNDSVVAGPASSMDDVVFTPGGPTIKECVTEVGNGSSVGANGTVVSGTVTYTIPACPLKSYNTNSTGWVTIANSTGQYYFIGIGDFKSYNYAIVDVGKNQTLYVTMPWPSGAASVSTSPPNSSGHSQVAGQVYKVTFQQAGWCTPPVYTAPWEVTLGNETEVEPSNATLPIPTNSATESGAFQKYSTIVFSVPDGTYSYTVQIAGVQPTSGIIVVSGSDVTIGVSGLPPACVTIPTGQPSALKLNLNLSEAVTNPGSVSPDYAIEANISEFNTLTTYNFVSAVQSWPNANLSLGPCGTFEFPFGILLYQGHYTDQNISSGTPLTIYTPNANTTSAPRPEDCPAKPEVFSYDFAPQSNNAVVNLTWAADTTATMYSMSDSVSVVGYWSGSTGSSAVEFHSLSPGVYTVLAGDEWGNMVLEYITIK